MGFIIGGDKCQWQRVCGSVFVAGHYINRRPAMILYPARPNTAIKQTPVAILMDDLHAFLNPKFLAAKANEYVIRLNLARDRYSAMDVCNAIMESMEDCLKMPPEPKTGYEKTVAEMLLTVNGKTYERTIKEGEDNASGPNAGLTI
jgi:hypothetical protein